MMHQDRMRPARVVLGAVVMSTRNEADELQGWMSRPVLTLTAGQPASDAWATMHAEGVRHAVVVRGRDVVGVVSERDLAGEHGGRARLGKSVGDLMHAEVVVASPSTTTHEAAELLRRKRIGCLPVVERGRLVGIVTRSDLLARLAMRRRERAVRPAVGAADVPHAPHEASPNLDKRP
jgi:CBS domain-containing protein